MLQFQKPFFFAIFCTNDVMCCINSQYLKIWGVDSPAYLALSKKKRERGLGET